MTEEQFSDAILALLPSDADDVPDDALDLSRRAIDDFPDSAELLCLRAELLQLRPDPDAKMVDEAWSCLCRAKELEPDVPEILELIGDFLDELRQDLSGAEAAFREALELGGDEYASCGLARVLAEQGRREEALEVLSPGCCPFHDGEVVSETRAEIERGEWDP